MKKSHNKNNGITLVALVVTIIILLILAGVSIASLTENGLFEKAKLAKEKQENAQIKENTILGDYENLIGDVVGNRDTITLTQEQYKSLINKEYIYIEMDNNQNATTTWSKIAFNNKINGNMDFNAESYEVSLKAGKKYFISSGVYKAGGSNYVYMKIYDNTLGVDISKRGLSCGSASTDGGVNPIQCIYVPEQDCTISILEWGSSTSAVLSAPYSYWLVYEI